MANLTEVFLPYAQNQEGQIQIIKMNGAKFSPDRVHRYSLWRFWNKHNGYAAFICLNPSTADKKNNDPTVTRCINYAKSWGYGGMIMLNLFAYRSKDPKKLLEAVDLIGPDNNFHIRSAASKSKITIVAWGVNKAIGDRANSVLKLIREPHCLAITKNGSPWHPLYLKKNLKPILYQNKEHKWKI